MVIGLNTTGLLKNEKSHFLLFHGYLSLNSSLKRALLWYLLRPSCWGMRKLTPCAYSCLQLVFILVPWFVLMVIFWLYKYPATCLHLFEWQAYGLCMLISIPRSALKCKWSGRLFLRKLHCLILSIFEVTIKWDTFLGFLRGPVVRECDDFLLCFGAVGPKHESQISLPWPPAIT